MGYIELIRENYSTLLTSMGNTLLLTLLSLLFASVIGLIIGMMNVSKVKALNILGTIYVDVIRGVPLMVLAFFIYFGVPSGIQSMGYTNFRMTALTAGIIALALNAGAYMAEIVRAGIQAVDKGQMEAARSLGLSYGKAMKRVVLPQAIRTMIPSFINQFIITLKDTSILSVIGFPELIKAGQIIIGRNFETLKMWTIIAVMYVIVIVSLSKLANYVERRMARGK